MGVRARFTPFLPLAGLAILLAAACGRAGEGSRTDEVGALGVQNVAEPVPHLITAAQPTPEQVEGLREMGYDRFISLQLAEEPGAGWEEAGVPETGASFQRIPVSGAADLTRENVEALAAALEAAGEDETVLYCASSNRVGAMLALKAFWLDGAAAEEALALGRRAGMRALEPDVRRIMDEGGS